MGKHKDINLDQFKRAYRNALEKTAQRIGREIEKAYESQIYRFYTDYSPIVYERTGATWWASSGFRDHESWSQYLGDLQYQAGITVDGMNIQNAVGHPYRANTLWVFNRTWHYGIHGINRRTKRHKMKTVGRGKNKHTFEVSWDYRQFPTNTRPAPETQFIKAFNKIKQHKHLDEVFSDFWSKEAVKFM